MRLAFRDETDADFLVGVHTDTDTNHVHVHVTQVGTADECYMDSNNIERLRSTVADRFDGESIGTEATA